MFANIDYNLYEKQSADFEDPDKDIINSSELNSTPLDSFSLFLEICINDDASCEDDCHKSNEYEMDEDEGNAINVD